MNKQEFLEKLRKGLIGLPQIEIDDRLAFYSEMIDDQMEEGVSEKDAVLAVGSIDEIVDQIVAEIPLSKIAKERIKPKRKMKAWEIVLLALGSPIWLSLAVSAIAVIISVYASLWTLIISLWAVFSSLVGCFIGGIIAGIYFICYSNTLSGLAMIAAGVVCAGLSIFMFYGCKAATNGILKITKSFAVWIKNRFIVKEAA